MIIFVVLGGLALLIPLITGINIIARNPRNRLAQLAGLLTLKPLLATPLWFTTISSVGNGKTQPSIDGLVTTLLPGVGLTVLLLVVYHGVLRDNRTRAGAVWLLLLDCARWLNSFILLLSGGSYFSSTLTGLMCVTAPLGIVLPSIYAFVANWVTAGAAAKARNKLKNDEKPKRKAFDS